MLSFVFSGCSVNFVANSENGVFIFCFHHAIDTSMTTEQRLIWRAKNVELRVWKKVVITLPSDIDEYRLLLEGECNKSSRYYSRNHVMVDNLELLACSNRGTVLKVFFFCSD